MVYTTPDKFTVRLEPRSAVLLSSIAGQRRVSLTRCATQLLEEAITAESGRLFVTEEPGPSPEDEAAQARQALLEELQAQVVKHLAEALPPLIKASFTDALKALLPSVLRAARPQPLLTPKAARELATEFLSGLDYLRAVSSPTFSSTGRKEQIEQAAYQKASKTVRNLLPEAPSGVRPAGRTPDGRGH